MMPAINRQYLCYGFAFLLLSLSISAVAAPTWQGPYIGAYFGGGFGNNHVSTNAGSVTSTSYFATSADINAVNNSGTYTNNPSSTIVGIEAGHDWVWKQMVYGVVFDYGALPLNSSKSVNNTIYPDNADTYSVYTSMSTNWLLTLRGRLGYQAMLHWPSLLYLTGGMAATQLKLNNSFSDNSSYAGTGGNHTAQNQIGWTAGVGIELASFDNVSVDFEYLYIHIPPVKITSPIYNTNGGFGIPAQSLSNPFSTTGSFHANLFKIALNYRFDE